MVVVVLLLVLVVLVQGCLVPDTAGGPVEIEDGEILGIDWHVVVFEVRV